MNKFGYADTQLNETQIQFIARAIEDTVAPPAEASRKKKLVVDIGGGYGDVSAKIIEKNGNVLHVDVSREHSQFLEDWYAHEKESGKKGLGQLETAVGRMPFIPEKREDIFFIMKVFQDNYELVDIGSFSVMMYMDGPEVLNLLNWAFQVLPPGGRFYLTGVSGYSNVFPGYLDSVHRQRMQKFRIDPLNNPFPGWIPDVSTQAMAPFVPTSYHDQYPNYFHFLEPEVIRYHAENVGFEIIESRYLRRNFPERLRYTGADSDAGELTSAILQKPLQSAR